MFSGRVGSRLARLYDDGEFRLARPQCDAHDAPGWRAAADPCLARRRDVLRWILGSPFGHDGHRLQRRRSRPATIAPICRRIPRRSGVLGSQFFLASERSLPVRSGA